MKKLLFILITLLIVSCKTNTDTVEMLTEAISNKSVHIIKVKKNISSLYEEGDIITIKRKTTLGSKWEIENGMRNKDTLILHEGKYINKIGEYEEFYISEHVRVIIKKIFE